jgi:plasmid stabilization system protein ParE
MARLQYSRHASLDLARLADFLRGYTPDEAEKTADLIIDGLQLLKRHPKIGRQIENAYRELVISRGKTGYIALYRYDEIRDVVRVLAIRHQREVGEH